MGYTTTFEGQFRVTPALAPQHEDYLERFCRTRRMARKPELLEDRPDQVRIAAGLPLGPQGAYFVGSTAKAGQDFDDASVTEKNKPPKGQPSLWCHWTPGDAGRQIEWDGGEKFYHYVEWLEYLIEHFLGPWGYKLNGRVSWEGEEWDDRGTIQVVDSNVEVLVEDPGPDLRGQLHELVMGGDEPEDYREPLLEALAESTQDEVIESLQLFSEDLASHSDYPETMLALLQVVLEAPMSRVRAHAVSMLPNVHGDDEMVRPVLQGLAQDADEAVRQAAIKALATL